MLNRLLRRYTDTLRFRDGITKGLYSKTVGNLENENTNVNKKVPPDRGIFDSGDGKKNLSAPDGTFDFPHRPWT